MIYSTMEHIPGKDIESTLGVVIGNVVQSKHVGRDIMANLKGIVGGELRGYTEMLTEARDKAIERLLDQASQLGADAVVGVRLTTSSIANGASEVLAYGTAVKFHS